MGISRNLTSIHNRGLAKAWQRGSDPLSPGQAVLQELLEAMIVPPETWDSLSTSSRQEIMRATEARQVVAALVDLRLLTDYQAEHVLAGHTLHLLLGNYRILDRLGAGGMGIVYKAEHLYLRRLVAIKVLPSTRDPDSQVIRRFGTEMRTIAQLQHPNIVAAIDAGVHYNLEAGSGEQNYFVMEFVGGQDLEALIKEKGPLSTALACDLIYQIASALDEAHKRDLIHRDIKPSNICVTPEGQAKLLDFGLVRHCNERVTEPGVMLGTLDYIAPEQARDARAVDIRADIYGLGGTLFWCLAGRAPFFSEGDPIRDLQTRARQEPPSLRTLRSDVPPALDSLVGRMLAANRDQRIATPQAVMQALLPFLKPVSGPRIGLPQQSAVSAARATPIDIAADVASRTSYRILIVDDELSIRQYCRLALNASEFQCEEAKNGQEALDAFGRTNFDLVLLDIKMPGMTGNEVLRRLRESPPSPHLKIIMFSGLCTGDEMAKMLLAGADDYMTKPFSVAQLKARVKTSLRLKEAQDQAAILNQRLVAINQKLEQLMSAGDGQSARAREAIVLTLAGLLEPRTGESTAHLTRVQGYCRCLAEKSAAQPDFIDRIDADFIELLVCSAPLHDIGKAYLPNHILQKPGKLDPEETIVMQSHVVIGAASLSKAKRLSGVSAPFLPMAIEIARHHHERFDGSGYPDRLSGDSIPLAARIVTIGDVYDSLRSPRPYRPALAHDAALRVMLELSNGQFDPRLLRAFQSCAARFSQIFLENPEE